MQSGIEIPFAALLSFKHIRSAPVRIFITHPTADAHIVSHSIYILIGSDIGENPTFLFPLAYQFLYLDATI